MSHGKVKTQKWWQFARIYVHKLFSLALMTLYINKSCHCEIKALPPAESFYQNVPWLHVDALGSHMLVTGKYHH